MKIYCTNRPNKYNDISKYAKKDLWVLCDIEDDSENPYWIHVRKLDGIHCYCDLISDHYRDFLQETQDRKFLAYDFAITNPMWISTKDIHIVQPIDVMTEIELFGYERS